MGRTKPANGTSRFVFFGGFSMKNFIAAAALSLSAMVAPISSASAATINFDDGTDGTSVGAFYAGQGVTFSNAEFTTNFGLAGSSGALGIRAPGTFAFGPGNAIVGTFSALASSVSIRGIDVGAAGMLLQAFDASSTLIGSVSFFGPGFGVGTFQDLMFSAAGIKSFSLSQVSPCCGDGMLFENLEFTTAAGVPEAATWAMMLAGFGMIGFAMRRRQNVTVSFA